MRALFSLLIIVSSALSSEEWGTSCNASLAISPHTPSDCTDPSKNTFLTDPAYCVRCNNPGACVHGALSCPILPSNYFCGPDKTQGGTAWAASCTATCNDAGIRSGGYYSHGQAVSWEADLQQFCTPWPSGDATIGLGRCTSSDDATFNTAEGNGTVHICTKGDVYHVHQSKASTGLLMYKRMRCVSNKCFVLKAGLCLDLEDYPDAVYGGTNILEATHGDTGTKNKWATQAIALLAAHEQGTSERTCAWKSPVSNGYCGNYAAGKQDVVSSKEECQTLCLNDPTCTGGYWDGNTGSNICRRYGVAGSTAEHCSSIAANAACWAFECQGPTPAPVLPLCTGIDKTMADRTLMMY